MHISSDRSDTGKLGERERERERWWGSTDEGAGGGGMAKVALNQG